MQAARDAGSERERDEIATALVLRRAGLSDVAQLAAFGELRLRNLRDVGHRRLECARRTLARRGVRLPWVGAEDERRVRTLVALLERSPEAADRLSRDNAWEAALAAMPEPARHATLKVRRRRTIRDLVLYAADVTRVREPARQVWWPEPCLHFNPFLDGLEGFYQGIVAVALPASLEGVPRGGAKMGADAALAILDAAGIDPDELLGQLTRRELAELAARMGRGPAMAVATALQPGGPFPPVEDGPPRPADEPPAWASGEGRPEAVSAEQEGAEGRRRQGAGPSQDEAQDGGPSGPLPELPVEAPPDALEV